MYDSDTRVQEAVKVLEEALKVTANPDVVTQIPTALKALEIAEQRRYHDEMLQMMDSIKQTIQWLR